MVATVRFIWVWNSHSLQFHSSISTAKYGRAHSGLTLCSLTSALAQPNVFLLHSLGLISTLTYAIICTLGGDQKSITKPSISPGRWRRWACGSCRQRGPCCWWGCRRWARPAWRRRSWRASPAAGASTRTQCSWMSSETSSRQQYGERLSWSEKSVWDCYRVELRI